MNTLVCYALSFVVKRSQSVFPKFRLQMCVSLRDSLVGDLTDGFEDLLNVDDADLEDYNLREYQSTIF